MYDLFVLKYPIGMDEGFKMFQAECKMFLFFSSYKTGVKFNCFWTSFLSYIEKKHLGL